MKHCFLSAITGSHVNMAEIGSSTVMILQIKTPSALPRRGKWYINLPSTTFNDIEEKEIRVVLLGRTGAGKSATGNMIAGKEVFEESSGPVSATTANKVVSLRHAEYKKHEFHMIDTPGLFDTRKNREMVEREVGRAILTFHEGIHAFIYVHNPSERFTEEHRKTIRQIKVT